MSIALDGFEVLHRLGAHPELFAPVRLDADKAARALVLKCLKAKSVGVEALRNIRAIIGDEPFALLLDGLKDAEVKSILTRLDKHCLELKQGRPASQRQQLRALAEDLSDPSPPPKKAAKTKAASDPPGKPAAPKRLGSEVMEQFREAGKSKG